MKNLREDISEIIAKTKQFYESKTTGQALIKVKNIQGLKTQPSLDLTKFDFSKRNQLEDYNDNRAEGQLLYWAQRLSLLDDTIPSIGPWFGIAEHSAFLGGVVEYSSETSWPEPFMDNASELHKLSMDENNLSFRMVVDSIVYLREKYGDRLAPLVRGASGVLEMANSYRGSDFFYDFYNEDGSFEAFLDYCEKGLLWYYDAQLEAVGDFLGGSMTGFGEWLPGRGLGHISEDTTTMISVDQFMEFGVPRTQKIIEQFDSAFMHVHALSEHALPAITKLEKLLLMELSSDPNTDRAVEVYRRNREKIARDVIPVLLLTREEIENNMDLLKEQKTIIWYNASSMEDAEDMTKTIANELSVR